MGFCGDVRDKKKKKKIPYHRTATKVRNSHQMDLWQGELDAEVGFVEGEDLRGNAQRVVSGAELFWLGADNDLLGGEGA